MAARIEVDGGDAALAALKGAVARAERPVDLWRAVGESLVESTRSRFEAERAPDGNPWPASIRKMVEGGRTLTLSSRLVDSIAFEADDAGVAVGTNVIYAAIHQFGGKIEAKSAKGLRFRLPGNRGFVSKQSVTIPARPFLGLDAEDALEIEALAGEWLGPEVGDAGD